MNQPSDASDAERATMTYAEAAQRLGVVRNTIYTLVTRGRLHPISTDGTQVKRLLREEVEQYAGQAPGDASERATMTYAEAARYLGIVPGYFYILVSEGSFHPIKVTGSTIKRVLREEVERYAAGASRRQLSRAELEAANRLAESMLWGVSDEGDGGVMMRQQVLEQVGILGASAVGREHLARVQKNIQNALDHDPLLQAASAHRERERFTQFVDIIAAKLATPLEEPHATKSRQGRTSDAPTSKRPRLTATPK